MQSLKTEILEIRYFGGVSTDTCSGVAGVCRQGVRVAKIH